MVGLSAPGKESYLANEGIKYFPLDCKLDEKFELIEAEYGLKGFAIVVKLYQRIYGGHGYYCEWSDDIALIFAKSLGFSSIGANGFLESAERSSDSGRPKNLIDHVVTACIRRGIFSKQLFDKYGILTSRGVQRNFLQIVRNRKEVEMKKEYLLLSDAEIKGNVVKKPLSYVINDDSYAGSEQSKEEESKEKNNNIPPKPEKTAHRFDEGSFEIRCVDKIVASCLEQFPKSKVPLTIADKQKWASEIEKMRRIDNLTEGEILQGLDYAITDSFWKSNIRSAGKFREKFETLYLQSKGKTEKKHKFNNFKERDYDMDELEKALLE